MRFCSGNGWTADKRSWKSPSFLAENCLPGDPCHIQEPQPEGRGPCHSSGSGCTPDQTTFDGARATSKARPTKWHAVERLTKHRSESMEVALLHLLEPQNGAVECKSLVLARVRRGRPKGPILHADALVRNLCLKLGALCGMRRASAMSEI